MTKATNHRAVNIMTGIPFLFFFTFACLILQFSAVRLEASEITVQDDNSLNQALNEAVKAFNEKRYDEAIEYLEAVLSYRPKEIDALKMLAVSFFNNENFLKTIETAKRVLDLEKDQDIRFLLARSYEMANDLENAEVLYQQIAEDKADKNREAAEKSLERVKAQKAAELFPRPEGLSGLLFLSFEYDDNVATSVDPAFDIPLEIADYRLSSAIYADYDFLFGSRFYGGPGTLLIGNFHADEAQDFDLALARPNIHAGIVGKNWNLKFAFEYDYFEFDYNRFLISERFVTSLMRLYLPRYLFIMKGSIAHDDYIDNPFQEAYKSEFSWDNTIYIPEIRKGTKLHLNYKYLYNDAKQDSLYSYYLHYGALRFEFPLFWELYIKPEVNYEKRRYDDEPNPRRIDDTIEYSFTLEKKWTKDFSTEAFYRRTETDSTVDVFDKDQNVYGLTFTYSL